MGEEDKYIEEISKYGQAELCELWRRHLDDNLSADQKDFWKDGKLMEYTVLRGFEIEGASITWPYTVSWEDEGVEQIDGALLVNGIYVLVECKDHETNINIEPFSKLRNQLMRRPSGVIGCIFARKGFTDPAVALSRFAAPQTILLWNGAELEYCLEHSKMVEGLMLKLRKAVELFDYSYNAKSLFELKNSEK